MSHVKPTHYLLDYGDFMCGANIHHGPLCEGAIRNVQFSITLAHKSVQLAVRCGQIGPAKYSM